MEERLKKVIQDVFSVDEVDINVRMDNLSNWDSLKQINYMIALEEEFGISISPEEMQLLKEEPKSVLTLIETK